MILRLFVLVTSLMLAACTSEPRIATPNEVLSADLPRAALIIGNADYQSVAPLRNPGADARIIASSLRSAGFKIHRGGALVDLDREEMALEIAAFAEDVSRSGGIAFVYFAGHGIQVEGRNHLIPVDAAIRTTTDIPRETVDLQSLLSALDAPNIEMKVIVIDACRDNPFDLVQVDKPASSRTGRGDPGLRSLSAGLSELIAPPGALVAFATAPGSVALDGDGENSPYAAALATVVGEPGLRVEDVFISVRNQVRGATRGLQVPWETSSLTSVAAFTGSAATGLTESGQDQTLTAAWDGTYEVYPACSELAGEPNYSDARLIHVKNGRAELRDRSRGTTMDYWFYSNGEVRATGEFEGTFFGVRGFASTDEFVLRDPALTRCATKLRRRFSPNW